METCAQAALKSRRLVVRMSREEVVRSYLWLRAETRWLARRAWPVRQNIAENRRFMRRLIEMVGGPERMQELISSGKNLSK
jgi:hypothetical protein